MTTFDKICATIAIPIGILFMVLGIVGLFVGASAHFTLPPVLGALPFFLGWAMSITLIRFWREFLHDGQLRSSSNPAAARLGCTRASVFVVQHLHRLPSGEDSVFMIGVYRTETAAQTAVARLSSQPGFRKHPHVVEEQDDDDQGFHISQYELDKDHWTEGFVTMVGEQEYKE